MSGVFYYQMRDASGFFQNSIKYAAVAQRQQAPDLKSAQCGFESHQPHHFKTLAANFKLFLSYKIFIRKNLGVLFLRNLKERSEKMFNLLKRLNASRKEEIVQYVKNEYPNEYARFRTYLELIQNTPNLPNFQEVIWLRSSVGQSI